jgi:putative tryptophan/tyrosine transport system substrate-binding protein
MVIRIIVVLLLSLAQSSLGLAQAQQPKKIARVGFLSLGFPPHPSAPLHRNAEAFYQALREVGYTKGKNLIVEYRYSEGNRKRLPELATELVSSKVDLIVATSTPAIHAARQATTTIPIVMSSVGDPVTAEFIDSLPRPGGNITGVTGVVPALSGKLLQVLIDAVPRASRLGVLWFSATGRQALTPTEDAARALRVRLKILEVRNHDELDKAFIAATKDRTHGLVVLPAIFFNRHRKQIVELSIKSRLPTIYWQREFAEAGGLLTYGPSGPELYRRMGVLAGKILKGTKPAELPVEQPTKYELVVNLMTAKQIGITIPQSLLFRADHVIK